MYLLLMNLFTYIYLLFLISGGSNLSPVTVVGTATNLCVVPTAAFEPPCVVPTETVRLNCSKPYIGFEFACSCKCSAFSIMRNQIVL